VRAYQDLALVAEHSGFVGGWRLTEVCWAASRARGRRRDWETCWSWWYV